MPEAVIPPLVDSWTSGTPLRIATVDGAAYRYTCSTPLVTWEG